MQCTAAVYTCIAVYTDTMHYIHTQYKQMHQFTCCSRHYQITPEIPPTDSTKKKHSKEITSLLDILLLDKNPSYKVPTSGQGSR